MTILQKAVHIHDLQQFLGHSADLLAGYVVPAAQVDGLTPAQLHSVHRLAFAGSPFPSEPEYVDVLRFRGPGGELQDAVEPEVRDRPSYTWTGFESGDGGMPVPVYYLDPVRVPAGAELWRISGQGAETLLGVHPDTATGWVPVGWDGRVARRKLLPQDMLGTVAVWDFNAYLADIVDGGEAVVLCAFEKPDDEELEDGELDQDEFWEPWVETARGLWRKKVDIGEVTDVFEAVWTCTYRGLRWRITAQERSQDGQETFKLHYIGQDASSAESLGLKQSDAGVYRAAAARDDVVDLSEVQLRPLTARPAARTTSTDKVRTTANAPYKVRTTIDSPYGVPYPGQWALWQGGWYEAQTYSDKERLILLRCETESAPGDGWQETAAGCGSARSFTRGVPFEDLEAYEEFKINAHWRGYGFSLMRIGADEFALGWAGERDGSALARGQLMAELKQSGYWHHQIDQSTVEAVVPVAELTAFQMVRHRNLMDALKGKSLSKQVEAGTSVSVTSGITGQGIVSQIVSLVVSSQKPGWDRIEIWWAEAAGFGSSSIDVVAGGETTSPCTSEEVLDLLEELKDSMYRPDIGTWLSVRISISADGSVDIDYNYDEPPEWAFGVEPGLYGEELERYPRPMENIPNWMMADAGYLPASGDAHFSLRRYAHRLMRIGELQPRKWLARLRNHQK
ncbi:hypothetical protein [Arthrobacter crystallopoietes]|uniref:Uncharacterized protein n=1 Tax=Crystallibacter crystallopoietes TaxID=37928 RepID=A0A1H1ETG3_9MICC|nr:hypothetical protein [Arthrobacter crystallopoietes]AUI49785.1 hypothetical protein AC20117_02055 [Arthrobacter crystallopoietes]SDQ92037.1 hypothetical protein SAMN04489742_3084 [Arthrobacter crystallopoietes]